jgi:hypothetical protein
MAGTRPKAMSTALTAPRSAPMARAARIATGTPTPASRMSLETTTMTTASEAPTDTSIPAVHMMGVMAIPITAMGAIV